MYLKLENKILSLKTTIVILFMLSCFSTLALAAGETKVIPIKVAEHNNFTRIVFNMPKLSAYHIEDKANHIIIHLDTAFRPVLSSRHTSLISGIETSRNKEGLLEINISTNKKTKVKDYRLQKKIILDIYNAKIAIVKQKIIKNKKISRLHIVKKDNVVNITNTKDKKAAILALEKSLSSYITPSNATPPTGFGLKLAKKIKTAKVEKVEKKTLKKKIRRLHIAKKTSSYNEAYYQKNPTVISLSFLDPTRLAVFKRSKTLWIVTDSTTASILPTIKGPLSRFISYPDILRFKNGSAYAYKLPKDFAITIEKQNLLWHISLSPKAKKEIEDVETQTYFDKFNRNAKMSFVLKGAGEDILFEDPIIGDILHVIPTKYADQVVVNKNETVDFKIKPAALGMVVKPFLDELKVYPVDNFVFITSPNGLKITPAGMGTPVLVGDDAIDEEADSKYSSARIFDFPNWSMGGLKHFYNNKQKLQDEIISANNPEDRAGAMMKLALLYFSNNFGHETLGLLDLLLEENPEMERNSLFIAVRGAAYAMSGRYKKALHDLSAPSLKNNLEARLWMGLAAAATEQWTRANKLFPKSNRLLIPYPDTIAIPLTIYMAESSLHLGRANMAEKLLNSINMKSEIINSHYVSAINYLRGEIYKQKDNRKKAEKLWQPVADGIDRLYHTKATLSLTRLLLKEKKISLHEAIERLENLRFAWRGDGVEIEILRNLGNLKAKNNQPLAGLEDLKKAVKLSKMILIDSTPLRDMMTSIFVNLFMQGGSSKVTPLEAISVYNEFNYLIPSGNKGVIVSLSFADYLIEMDLLKEATDIMEVELNNDMAKAKIPKLGAKLAAIYLLDRKPEKALSAIRKTNIGEISDSQYKERTILKARAYSQAGNDKMATLVLNNLNSKDSLLLKADIFWKQEKWAEAARTLKSLLPNPETANNKKDLSIILNTAVALRLSNQILKLKEIKNKYLFAIKNTDFENIFNVITREAGSSKLADRKTTLKIAAEADIFKSFLESYKRKKEPGS